MINHHQAKYTIADKGREKKMKQGDILPRLTVFVGSLRLLLRLCFTMVADTQTLELDYLE